MPTTEPAGCPFLDTVEILARTVLQSRQNVGLSMIALANRVLDGIGAQRHQLLTQQRALNDERVVMPVKQVMAYRPVVSAVQRATPRPNRDDDASVASPSPMIERARAAVGEFRRAAREGRVIKFRQRDPLVLAIHDALDRCEAAEAQVSALTAALQAKDHEIKSRPSGSGSLCPAVQSADGRYCLLKPGHAGQHQNGRVKWTVHGEA